MVSKIGIENMMFQIMYHLDPCGSCVKVSCVLGLNKKCITYIVWIQACLKWKHILFEVLYIKVDYKVD